MTIKDVRQSVNMTQKEFAEYFGIPIRTLQNWDAGTREPADYLLDLIKYKIEKERLGMFKLIEKNHGEVNVLVEGTLAEIIEYLTENAWNLYNWILDEEPKRELPTFEDVGTLKDLEYKLNEFDFDWWSLEMVRA